MMGYSQVGGREDSHWYSEKQEAEVQQLFLRYRRCFLYSRGIAVKASDPCCWALLFWGILHGLLLKPLGFRELLCRN